MMTLKLSDFEYRLPEELIAHYPLENRRDSRLMVLDGRAGHIQHEKFAHLLNFLNENDLLVFNDTRVIPARIYGKKLSGGKIEILIERIVNQNQILAHVRASKALKPETLVEVEGGYNFKMLEREGNLFRLEFLSKESLLEVLERIGHIPLPPYINRSDESLDQERYQTVYGVNPGAVAAPTAGLHFDEAMLAEIEKRGIDRAFVTLHVGAGTFQPVRVENIEEHHMHAEYVDVKQAACDKINAAKARGGRVIAVGTTALRSLETASQSGIAKPFLGDTSIFIYPGYQFQCVDALVTNFHLPESTLLMLVSAFAGYEHIMNAYAQAVQERYRFFSYGDAMFIQNRISL